MRNGSLLSRTAALLLLLAGIWSAWSFVEAPVLAGVAADRERMQGLREALSAPAIDAPKGESLRRFIDRVSWPLDRSTPELLSAQLQRSIEGLAAGAGATVASSRTIPVTAQGGLVRIGLDFDIQASLPSLQALLVQIGRATPRIFIDRLTVQVAEGGIPQKGADGQSELGVGMQVSIDAAPHRDSAL